MNQRRPARQEALRPGWQKCTGMVLGAATPCCPVLGRSQRTSCSGQAHAECCHVVQPKFEDLVRDEAGDWECDPLGLAKRWRVPPAGCWAAPCRCHRIPEVSTQRHLGSEFQSFPLWSAGLLHGLARGRASGQGARGELAAWLSGLRHPERSRRAQVSAAHPPGPTFHQAPPPKGSTTSNNTTGGDQASIHGDLGPIQTRRSRARPRAAEPRAAPGRECCCSCSCTGAADLEGPAQPRKCSGSGHSSPPLARNHASPATRFH